MLQRLGRSRKIRHGSDARDKVKDTDETTSEASWTAVTRGKEKEVWSLEREGEAEKPEATGLGSEVKGISVNPEVESRHRDVRAKMARKERESQTRMEKKVNGKAPWDDGTASDSGSLLRWLSMMIRSPTRSICVSSVTTKE